MRWEVGGEIEVEAIKTASRRKGGDDHLHRASTRQNMTVGLQLYSDYPKRLRFGRFMLDSGLDAHRRYLSTLLLLPDAPDPMHRDTAMRDIFCEIINTLTPSRLLSPLSFPATKLHQHVANPSPHSLYVLFAEYLLIFRSLGP